MTEEAKYYTPKIEEYHVGFEYEVFEDFDSLPEKSWHKFAYGDAGTNDEGMAAPSESNIRRVKYLDKEDIESLGWKLREGSTHKQLLFTKEYGGITYNLFFIYIVANDSRLSIYSIDEQNGLPKFAFAGVIKNKSELKNQTERCGIV